MCPNPRHWLLDVLNLRIVKCGHPDWFSDFKDTNEALIGSGLFLSVKACSEEATLVPGGTQSSRGGAFFIQTGADLIGHGLIIPSANFQVSVNCQHKRASKGHCILFL